MCPNKSTVVVTLFSSVLFELTRIYSAICTGVHKLAFKSAEVDWIQNTYLPTQLDTYLHAYMNAFT